MRHARRIKVYPLAKQTMWSALLIFIVMLCVALTAIF